MSRQRSQSPNQHARHRREAKIWVAKQIGLIAQGKHTPNTKNITVKQLAEFWNADNDERVARGELEKATAQAYKVTCNRHIVPFLGNHKANELEPWDVTAKSMG